MKVAKKTSVTPDFEKIAEAISRKYNAEYADDIITDARIDWYSYLVEKKRKMADYWPELIHCQMIKIEKVPLASRPTTQIKNLCYDIFKHSEEQTVLDSAVKWMKEVAAKEPAFDTEDAYACVLYKDGDIADGIVFEQMAIDELLSDGKASQKYIDGFRKKLELMKHGVRSGFCLSFNENLDYS